jgi:hypothetical protein
MSVRITISEIVVLLLRASYTESAKSRGLKRYKTASITEDRDITRPRFHRLLRRSTIMASTDSIFNRSSI